ncbi:ankyrin [Rhizoclosmatium globosum]|uniref:Ankyrin n=1 Tax=Rhizoclosmatium globosum TaxID=329046 RepID=A0A1Y2B9Z5_9FUNG|nr:ankyrin [Rhizoclosmatium globosum]|eukprot:ORY30905.1 ankyrin [Rhizoclosmatium globosum]
MYATTTQLLSNLASYPIDEDGDSFIDVMSECVRYNEVDNIATLISFLTQNTPASTEFSAFSSKAASAIERLDRYYAGFANEVRAFEAANPTPTFETEGETDEKPDQMDIEANTVKDKAALSELKVPEPSPPLVEQVPELSHPLKTLLRTIAITPCKQGFTPLHAAAANNHLPLLSLFFLDALVLPADLNSTVSTSEDGGTALHWACLNGHLEIVKVLVKLGANIGAKNLEGKSPLGLAEMMGRERVVNWIVENCDVGLDDDSSMADAMESKAALGESSSSSANA